MKSFMEEYGKSIVVAIVIVALIGVACVFRDSGTKSIKSMWENFKSYMKESQCECLCFTADAAGSTISMSKYGTTTLGQNFQYSTDGKEWAEFTPGSTIITLTNIGDKVYFKGNNSNGVNESYSIYYQFEMTGSIAGSGNVMSLIDDGACTTVVIPNSYCFYRMFNACTSLTTAPTLPATTLATNCYREMFQNCTSLITVPVLPATTLAQSCYYCMFSGCTSLYVSDASSSSYSKAWRIPTSGTFTNSYSQGGMFSGCAGTRSSNMAGQSGQSYTYYTQNTPV